MVENRGGESMDGVDGYDGDTVVIWMLLCFQWHPMVPPKK